MLRITKVKFPWAYKDGELIGNLESKTLKDESVSSLSAATRVNTRKTALSQSMVPLNQVIQVFSLWKHAANAFRTLIITKKSDFVPCWLKQVR